MPFNQLFPQPRACTLELFKAVSELDVKIMSLTSSLVGVTVESSIRMSTIQHRRKSRFSKKADTNKKSFNIIEWCTLCSAWKFERVRLI